MVNKIKMRLTGGISQSVMGYNHPPYLLHCTHKWIVAFMGKVTVKMFKDLNLKKF